MNDENPYAPPDTSERDEPEATHEVEARSPAQLPIVTMLAIPFSIAIVKAVCQRVLTDSYPMNVVNAGIVLFVIVAIAATTIYEVRRYFLQA